VSLDLSLYLVTDAAQCAHRGRTVEQTAADAAAGGATAVQVREKHLPAGDVLAVVERVVAAVPPHVAVLVDDRVDVVLAARRRGVPVAGVHVGQRDLAADDVRALLGPDLAIGVTAGTPAQLRAVAASGAAVDYVGVGVVHATTTKPDAPAPIGVAGVARLVAASALPVVAIGGIGRRDIAPLREVGVAGAAVVSAICAAPDARAAAAELRLAWDDGAAAGDSGDAGDAVLPRERRADAR
jgi:thiamine-phosphate diphosphorylase